MITATIIVITATGIITKERIFKIINSNDNNYNFDNGNDDIILLIMCINCEIRKAQKCQISS